VREAIFRVPILVSLCIFLLPSSAHAQSGSSSLDLARDAWNRGELAQAESLLNEALSRGGLKRTETLECYVRLGSARAVLGKKDSAQAAFRLAALMDANFVVPSDAGKKAVQLADNVRKAQVGFGELALKLDVPSSTKPATSIEVKVSMDGAHTSMVTRVGLVAKESTSGKTFNFELSPAETMHFTVPSSLALPNGDVSIHVEALDKSDNQLAFSDGRVRVSSPKKEEPTVKAGGGFWSSAWPYVIGGFVLAGAAAGGVGVYFVSQQGASHINVGAPSVRPGG